MFEWLKNRTKKVLPTASSILEQGSSHVVEEKVRSVRHMLTDIRSSIGTIAESGHDADRNIETNGELACTQIEAVLQNLKTDPDDITRLGLALEALSPVRDLLSGCARACNMNSNQVLVEVIPLSAKALRETSDRFRKLREGAVVLNDSIQLAGLARTVSRLFGS